MAVAPVTYGASARPPRGDIRRRATTTRATSTGSATRRKSMRCMRGCSPAKSSRRPVRRARNLSLPWASWVRPTTFLASNRSPSRLQGATGWEVVAVPGLIPEHAFFSLLAHRRFPVTVWLRSPDGVRLHRRARRVSRSVWPRAAAVQSGVRRLHAGFRPRRFEGAGVKSARISCASVLVHRRIRFNHHCSRFARLRRRSLVFRGRDAIRPHEPRSHSAWRST